MIYTGKLQRFEIYVVVLHVHEVLQLFKIQVHPLRIRESVQ